MKRNIFAFAAFLMLAFFTYSCTTREESFLEDPASSLSDIALVDDGTIVDEPAVMVEDFILDDEENPETKTVLSFDNSGAHFTFTTGDRIGVFPYTVSGAPQMPFTLKSSSAESCYFNCPGFSLRSGVRYAAYYPYNPTDQLSYTAVPVNYTGQWQPTATTPAASTSSNFNISSADYLLAQAAPSGGACQFKMSHIGALVVMDITIGQSATYKELSLNSSSASFIQTGTLNVGQTYTQGTNANPTQGIAITSTSTANKMTLKLGSSTGSGIALTAGQTYRFCMMVPPTNVTGIVSIKLKDSSNVEHTAYVGNKNLLQGYAYRYSCKLDAVTNLSASGTANSYIVNVGSINSDGYMFTANVAGNGNAPNWASIGFTDGEGEAYPTGGGSSISGNGVEIILNQNSCINNVFYDNGKIYFKASGNKGNAKLTLTNNGTRVWTWHIWCTNQPSTINITSKVNSHVYAVMDRNLGAYDECTLPNYYYSEEACGLYYVYGHYIGFTVSEFSSGDEGGWRMIDTYALHPEKPYLKYGDNYMSFNSWGASGYQEPYAMLWGSGSYYKGNYTTGAYGYNYSKTMYDPCPPGYKVISYDVFDGYANDAAGANGGYYGVSISGSNGTLFLPYNGTIYRGGLRTFQTEPIGGTRYTVATRGWKVNLWTSRYWQNLCPSAYSIEMRVSGGSKYPDDTMNGSVKQNGNDDALTIGHGVRCMVGS
ncbi:MAG: fimbrillin family protein [Bacteroidales bacterium]|nr:fimbrillin family protein [Bacteroidales bacterium]